MSNVSGITESNSNIRLDIKVQIRESSSESTLSVKNGDTIRGTVLSVFDSEQGKLVNINVGDNVISAKLSDGMGLRQGQTLSFIVRGTGESSLTISPLLENTAVTQSTLKALDAAGLEINNDNIQMVRDMMEAGLPIDKNSLLEMSKNLNNHPTTNVTTMVEMKSLNIPITDNNIQQFESYKNFEHQVIKDMADIVNGLPEAFNELAESGNEKGAINFYGSVLQLFGEAGNITDNSETVEITGDKIVSEEEATEPPVLNGENMEKVSEEKVQNKLQNNLLDTESKNIEAAGEKSSEGRATVRVSGTFINNLSELNVSDKAISDLLKGNSQTMFRELAQAFSETDLSNSAEATAWKKLLSSEDYNKLLKENISSEWFLEPNDVEKKENIENLYQKLGNQIKNLSDTINNALGTESKLGQSAGNLSNNLDFMNQLNQMFQYVQLPLQMTGQKANGDLYVYHNKNKRLSEDGSVSAILHLDMENLGPVDVYVKMKDNKVNTNFYVADEEVIDLINDNIHILNERLEKRGYTMQAKLMLQDEIDTENGALDEMLDVQHMPILSTNSFDARA